MLHTIIAISFFVTLCFQNVAVTLMTTFKMPYHIKVMKHHEAAQKQKEAVRLWEQAIAAKGGRERLHAVHNMVSSTRGEYGSRFLGKNQVRGETLFVFPNKYWNWSDYRPDVFGLRVSMYNFDTNMKYIISHGDPNHPSESITDRERKKVLRNAQLFFLLETKWLKPTIVKASTRRVGLRHVDVVETMIEGERVDFAFDRKTHLPVRVSYYDYDAVTGKTYVNVQGFSDYTEVGGIKMPQTIVGDDGAKHKASFRFNVEYNEDIFVTPPSISAGPEAWKLVRR